METFCTRRILRGSAFSRIGRTPSTHRDKYSAPASEDVFVRIKQRSRHEMVIYFEDSISAHSFPFYYIWKSDHGNDAAKEDGAILCQRDDGVRFFYVPRAKKGKILVEILSLSEDE